MKIKYWVDNHWNIGLFVIIGVHLYLLSRLIFFPYPELFIYSYLTDLGLLPYKQILDQHFPGLMFFPINLSTLGMTSPEIARLWHYGVIALLQATLFVVARRLFKSDKWALLTNLLYLIWQPFFEGYVLWIDTFVPIFLLLGFYFLQGPLSKTRNLFLSGLLLGVALLLKQVTLPLLVLAGLVLVWKIKNKKYTFYYLLGVGIPIVFLVFYILSIRVWEDFIYWTLTFNLTTFAQIGRKLPTAGGILKALPVFGSAGFLALYLYYKHRSIKIMWLGVFFFASLAYAFARFDEIHLQPALPFAVLLLGYFFYKLPKIYFKLVLVSFLAVSLVPIVSFYKINTGNRTLFFGDLEKQLSVKVQELTDPTDKIFAFGTTPHLYQMTNRLPPGEIFVFQFPWFMKVAENMVLSGIISDPPKVVVRDVNASTGGLSLVDNMANINFYIERNYLLIDKVQDIEILIRK